MTEPIRILYVNGGLMNRGGIESYMMNYYRHFDRNRVQIDFVVHNAGGFGYYDEEIKAMGGRIYVLPQKSRHPLNYTRKLKEVLHGGNYKIVHTHMDAMGAWALKAAKECGVPVRIAHSHNTQHLTTNPLKLFVLEQARRNINRYATHRIACSDAAGKWLFGNEPFLIVRNAIDIDRFKFSPELRSQIRREYGIGDDDFLIGHVGRFDTQKNHAFLIDVFAEVWKQCPNCKLMFIGEGRLQATVKQSVTLPPPINIGGKDRILQNSVIFTGARDDVFSFYNAFDLFVLPSLFEGLGIVSIEAQVNGCPNLLSSTIPAEVNISRAVKFLPLQKRMWIEKIIELYQQHNKREAAQFNIDESGYSIEKAARHLQEQYIELWKRAEEKEC